MEHINYSNWQLALALAEKPTADDFQKILAELDPPQKEELVWGLGEANLHPQIFNLEGRNIENQALEGLNFSYFDFSQCTIEFTVFKNCNLIATSFEKATLNNCSFINCQWIQANCYEMKAVKTAFKNIQWQKGFMRWMQFEHCELEGVDFSYGLVTSTDFSNSRFKDVSFDGCELSGLDFPKGFEL